MKLLMNVLLLTGWLFIQAFVFLAVCGMLALFYRDQSAIDGLKSGIKRPFIWQFDEYLPGN
jgi:hypothetical protein